MTIADSVRLALGSGVAALLGYLLAWPIPISPQAWTPPPAPGLSVGAIAGLTVLPVPDEATEDVAIGPDGALYTGGESGKVWRLGPDRQAKPFADTHGRPLGMAFSPSGDLVVADTRRGLLSISRTGTVRLLADAAGGRRFGLTDDLAVGPDGKVYFTDASDRPWAANDYRSEIFEHAPNGRLLMYDPATKKTALLVDRMYFPNGVAVSPVGDYVLVAETISYRVVRHWLKGPRAGTQDVFANNLPGFPDGLSASPTGGYWVALVSPRVALLDTLLPHPQVRKVVARIPPALVHQPKRFTAVLRLDAQGHITRTLHDPAHQPYTDVTNAVEHGPHLYLGSLVEHGLAELPLK